MKKKFERLKDAQREVVPMILLLIAGSFIIHAQMVQFYPPKLRTISILCIGSFILFIVFTSIVLWAILSEKTYKPTFSFPFAFILLILSIAINSLFVLLLATEFTKTPEHAEFIFKITLFVLSLIGFCCYRAPNQTQYWVYAVFYAIGVLASWIVESDPVLQTFSNIISVIAGHVLPPEAIFVTITDFAIPIKEAMLLFIIWDVFLKAKEDNHKEK